jgi:hypothetical protein
MKGRARQQGSVSIFLRLGASTGIDTPAISYQKQHWTGHMGRTVATIAPTNKRFFR